MAHFLPVAPRRPPCQHHIDADHTKVTTTVTSGIHIITHCTECGAVGDRKLYEGELLWAR